MLTGNNNPKRYIQGKLHINNYAYLEGNNEEFYKVVNDEHIRWNEQAKPDYQLWVKEYQDIFQKAFPIKKEYCQIKTEDYSLQYTFNHRINVWFQNGPHYYDITDISIDNETYAIVEDKGAGAELYEVTVYRSHVPVWSKKNIGPTVVLRDGYLYYQTAVNRLRYNKVYATRITTGKQTTIYIETNKKFNTELINTTDSLFIRSTNGLKQKLDIVRGKHTQRIISLDSTIIPLNESVYLTNTRLEPFISLPRGQYAVDGLFFNNIYYIITVHRGLHTLYTYDNTWNKICSAPTIHFLKHSKYPLVQLGYHWKSSEIYDILNHMITLQMPNLYELDHYEDIDNEIPYSIVWKKGTKPRALLVTAYGAYGIEAQRDYPIRWLPWINNGYAFSVAMPRGGRDNGDSWYDEARGASRKHRTFEDTAHIIKTVQNRLKISPKKTLFFGRSAGGWVSAIIALKYNKLVAGVIAEVPYVDVLRTTSNPKLPLTTLEYDEFGDPIHNKADYEALLKISPVDLAKKTVPQNTHILIKTALHDSEVATYESLKFSTVLREKGWNNIYVSIDDNGGHFLERKSMVSQYAEDAAYFSFLLRANSRTRKSSTHASKGTTRRVKSSLKHVISNETSPEAV
jgi:protease II